MSAQIKITSPEQWHELRAQHIGGSEVAALFGENPYLSRYELWHRKAGTLAAPDLSANERVFWGTVLEPAVAEGVARKTGWSVRKVRRYFSRRPELGLGGSLDYEIVANDRGPGVLEIKTADWLVVRDWEGGQPPLSYELQLQSYFACTGRAWGAMAVLVGGNDLKLFTYERRPKTIATIEAEVAAFWRQIEEGTPPSPDFERDAETVAKVYGRAETGSVADLSHIEQLPALIAEYQRAAGEEAAAERARKRAKAEILALAGGAETVLCGSWRLNLSEVAATPDRIIGAEMVGQVIKGRSGFRNLRIGTRKDIAA
jgi:putative phage-type endonuclease